MIHLFLVLLLGFFLFLVILLLGSLNYSRCNAVQISLTILADPPPTVIRFLQDTNLLQ